MEEKKYIIRISPLSALMIEQCDDAPRNASVNEAENKRAGS